MHILPLYRISVALLTLGNERLAIFYLISVLASGFSSILSFGLIQMEGVAGFHGWRWIFVGSPGLTMRLRAHQD